MKIPENLLPCVEKLGFSKRIILEIITSVVGWQTLSSKIIENLEKTTTTSEFLQVLSRAHSKQKNSVIQPMLLFDLTKKSPAGP
jgi:hypothetical protein